VRRPKLTETQEEVLLLVGDGLTYPEIGAARGTSASSADKTTRRLKEIFGVKRKSELVKVAHSYYTYNR